MRLRHKALRRFRRQFAGREVVVFGRQWFYQAGHPDHLSWRPALGVWMIAGKVIKLDSLGNGEHHVLIQSKSQLFSINFENISRTETAA